MIDLDIYLYHSRHFHYGACAQHAIQLPGIKKTYHGRELLLLIFSTSPPLSTMRHLDISASATRVRAAMASVRAASSASMPRVMRLLDNDPIPLVPAPHKQRQQARDGEEDAVHDPERKGGLQHRARLVCGEVEPVHGHGAQGAGDGVGGVVGDVGAVCVGDEAELVDAADEGADEEEVDEGDEESVGAGAVVGEEGRDRPGGAEDGDDEEDEDVVRREGVGFGVDVHEVGEHAEGGDLWGLSCCHEELGLRRLTRVMISMKRQKAKKTPKIIFAEG